MATTELLAELRHECETGKLATVPCNFTPEGDSEPYHHMVTVGANCPLCSGSLHIPNPALASLLALTRDKCKWPDHRPLHGQPCDCGGTGFFDRDISGLRPGELLGGIIAAWLATRTLVVTPDWWMNWHRKLETATTAEVALLGMLAALREAGNE